MPQQTDATFVQVPMNVLLDGYLTLQARAVYALLLAHAWERRPDRRATRVFDVPVQLPPQEDLADAIGVSLNAFKKHLADLRNAGYIETSRAQRQQPLVYVIREFPPPPGETVQRSTDVPADDRASGGLAAHAVDVSRAGGSLLVDRENYESGAFGSSVDPTGLVDWTTIGKPPDLIQNDHGRVEAFDALAQVCGIDDGSPRLRQVAIALHGGGGTKLKTQPGINRLFWQEIARGYKVDLDEVRQRAADNPHGYQQMLVAAIRRRADQYRQRLRGAEMSPTALADWWLDLEHGKTGTGDRPLTSDEIRERGRNRRG